MSDNDHEFMNGHTDEMDVNSDDGDEEFITPNKVNKNKKKTMKKLTNLNPLGVREHRERLAQRATFTRHPAVSR
jgi:hypothetical protein